MVSFLPILLQLVVQICVKHQACFVLDDSCVFLTNCWVFGNSVIELTLLNCCKTKMQRGLVAMASMGPDQNGSEFFITVDTLAELNGQYVVFGEVIEGMSIVDRINGLALNEDESPSIAVVIAECGQL